MVSLSAAQKHQLATYRDRLSRVVRRERYVAVIIQDHNPRRGEISDVDITWSSSGRFSSKPPRFL